jgi:hypothetical protein
MHGVAPRLQDVRGYCLAAPFALRFADLLPGIALPPQRQRKAPAFVLATGLRSDSIGCRQIRFQV